MIKEFRVEDAQSLADMFNASDESWPGGFTHGMPITAEMLLDHMKKETPISTLVVWDGDKIVGIMELTEYWRDTNVLYVGFLNVVPSHHGRGLGRDLLKACVKKSTELHCKRLDLHTWAGNMKAVPLYKKTGFFWVPKTTVHMRNFVPLILNMDITKPYFEKHDWYKTFKREIKVEEDDFEGVFPYVWEEDSDILSVVIDAESGGVTQLENNFFSVAQKVGESFTGTAVKVTWVIKNKTETPLDINLMSRGGEGVSINKRESLVLGGEEEKEITGEAFVDYKAEIRKKTEPPHFLTTEVVVNGKSLSLVSGLRVKHPIEVSTHPEYLFLPKGVQEILVVLKNNQKKHVEGVITCQNTGESHAFTLKPEYTEGYPFAVTVEEDSDLQVHIEGTPVIHTIPVRVIDTGANVMQKGKEVILENVHSRIVVSLLGGETTILDKKTRELWAKEMSEELGPPFWPSELFRAVYAVKTESRAGKAVAEFSVESNEYNTRLTRRIEMDAGPVIKIEHAVIPPRNISLHLFGEHSLDEGILTIPLKEAIVSEPTMGNVFPLEEKDIPENPSEWKEQWVCYEKEGSAFGLVWETCTEIAVRNYSLLNITMSTESLAPLYIYAGSGTWKDVRALWSRVHKKEVIEEKPAKVWEVNPSVIVTVDNAIRPELTLESHRNKPMKGTVNGCPFEVTRGHPFTFDFSCDDLERGTNARHVHVETDLFEKKVPITVVRAGNRGDITVCEEDDIITVDNGLYTVKVAPNFCGSVIFFGKNNTNEVLTSYPEPTQLAWFRPWYGGIRAMLFVDEDEFPGRMHKETFTHDIIDTEKNGIPWKGVNVVCVSKEIKGIKLETSYLTTHCSNLLVVEHTLANLTSAPFDVYTGVLFYLQPEGSLTEATLYYEQEALQERRRTQYGGWVYFKDWAAVKGGNTYLTLISESVAASDMGKDGAHLRALKKTKINPHSTVTSVSYFAAAHTLEQSLQYKALRGLKWT